MKKTFLRTVGVFVATAMLCLGALPAYAEDKTYYEPRGMQAGDKIYYDNSVTGWDSVRIHIWNDWGTNLYGDDAWNIRPTMTDEDGDNIWEYVVPTENEICAILQPDNIHGCMDGFDYNGYRFSQLLFTDGQTNDGKQTSDLPFVTDGFVYKSTVADGSNGEVYLYDKIELLDVLNEAKEYASKIDCIDEEEAQRFIIEIDGLTLNVEGAGFITIEYDQDAGEFVFYGYPDEVQGLTTLITGMLESVIEKYGEEPTVCVEEDMDDESGDESDDELVNPDTLDPIGLYIGLGVASFTGLAISLNIKRRA